MTNHTTADSTANTLIDETDETDEAHELTEAIASITAIPFDVLPAGPARDALITLVEAGHDVNAYTPHLDPDTWIIWCEPAHAWMDGRYSPQEWQQVYASELVRILGSREVTQ